MWKQGDNIVRKLMTVRGEGQGGQEGDIQAEIILCLNTSHVTTTKKLRNCAERESLKPKSQIIFNSRPISKDETT